MLCKMFCKIFILAVMSDLGMVTASFRGNDLKQKSGAVPRMLNVKHVATVLTDRKARPNEHAALEPLQPANQPPHGTISKVDGSMTAAQQNPMESMGAAKDGIKSASPGGDTGDEHAMIGKWFTWEFWQLMVLCTLTILFFSELVSTIVHWFVRHSLVIDSGIFCAQNVSLMFAAAIFSSSKSAGGDVTRTLATVMASLSLLMFLGALSMKCQKI